jgi:hypothetical protein
MPTVRTTASREELVKLIRSLPAAMSGRGADPHKIGAGLRARIGWVFFSLVLPNFQKLGRGQAGADGTRWPDLSAKYKAYQKPIKGRGRPLAGKLAPGGNDGLLTERQLKQWRQVYASHLRRMITHLCRGVGVELDKGGGRQGEDIRPGLRRPEGGKLSNTSRRRHVAAVDTAGRTCWRRRFAIQNSRRRSGI